MNDSKSKRQSIYSIISAIVLLIILSVTIPITLAYLFDDEEQEGDATVGRFAIQFYTNSGATLVTNGLEVQLGNQSQATNVDLTFYNPHNISILTRILVTITVQEDIVLLNDVSHQRTNSIITKEQFDYDDDITEYYFYLYYNFTQAPQTHSKVIDSLTPLNSTYANQKVYISLYGEAIAYSGNPYKSSTPITNNAYFGALTPNLLSEWYAWE